MVPVFYFHSPERNQQNQSPDSVKGAPEGRKVNFYIMKFPDWQPCRGIWLIAPIPIDII